MNLVVNARDAMPQGGQLTLETANINLDEPYAKIYRIRPGSYIKLTIADTGHGMDEQTKSRIFEPFFSTKNQGKGTGLGLAIVYGIIEQSGGHIYVDSEPNWGTIFNIYLPEAEGTIKKTSPQLITPSASQGTETILLVEDEAGVRQVTYRFLEKRGYTVLQASHAEEALQVCQQHEGEIDLLITDVMMPDITGPELAEQLVQLYPTLKVLYISGYADDILESYQSQHTKPIILDKPFSSDTLVNKVREVLEGSTL